MWNREESLITEHTGPIIQQQERFITSSSDGSAWLLYKHVQHQLCWNCSICLMQCVEWSAKCSVLFLRNIKYCLWQILPLCFQFRESFKNYFSTHLVKLLGFILLAIFLDNIASIMKPECSPLDDALIQIIEQNNTLLKRHNDNNFPNSLVCVGTTWKGHTVEPNGLRNVLIFKQTTE